MTEPTIVCPNCKSEIKLTESLAAPLIAATRKQFEQQLAQKDSDIAQREQALRDKEKQLLDPKSTLDEQVADRVAEQQQLSAAKYLSYPAQQGRAEDRTGARARVRPATVGAA